MMGSEKQLGECFRALDDNGQAALVAFAEFLVQRNGQIKSPRNSLPEESTPVEEVSIAVPEITPRAEGESVIGGIKRLVASYPMIDRDQLSEEIQSLMTKHILKGVSAEEVIDQLEALFLKHYQNLRSASEID